MKKAKIQIIEDELIIAKDTQFMLENEGYEVPKPITSAKNAIEQIIETNPDLLLTDIRLNDTKTGIDIAKELKENDLDIPIIYITSYTDFSTVEEAKSTSPYGFIVKPYKEEELFITIDIAIHHHKINKKLKEKLSSFQIQSEIETENEIFEKISSAENDISKTDNEFITTEGEIPDEIKEIIGEFVSEAYHLLEDAEDVVDKLNHTYNQNSVNVLFRLFHSLKGSAGFLNLNNIKKLTHSAEDLLSQFRERVIVPSKSHIDVIYETFDLLEKQIKTTKKKYSDTGLENQTNMLIQKLNMSKQSSIIKEDSTNTPSQQEFNSYIQQAYKLIDEIETKIEKVNQKGKVKKLLPEILSSTYKLKNITKNLKYTELRNFIYEIINVLNSIMEKNIDTNTLSKALTDFYEQIKHYLTLCESNPQSYPVIKNKNRLIEKLRQIMDEHKIRPIKPIGQILVEMGVVDNQTIEKAIRYQKNSDSVQENILDIFDEKKKDIRIDGDKFDKLFEYIEEINALGGLLANFDLYSDDFDPDEFENLLFQFNSQMNNFQQFAYSIRVISLDKLFNKIKRLVSQLSRELDKEVELVIEDSLIKRVDKDIIEKITYPLVHLIRNSIDHGIESKEERSKTNKPIVGKVSITSINKSNEIWISVKDDGKGLNKDKILKTALKNGLIKESDISTMSERDIFKLIFESGFSTSDAITEISGRGVGMDVVNKNLEELRGKIDIKTEKGKGSEFTLKIPLSLMEVLTIIVDRFRYSIPINNVTEIFSYRDTNIAMLENGKEIVKLIDKTIPLIRLNNDLYKDTGIQKNELRFNSIVTQGLQKNDAIIIIERNNKTIGLYADFIEQIQQASIKSPGRYARKSKKILGLSILGNGDITVILDIDEIIREHLK